MACLKARPFPLPKLHTIKSRSPPSHLAQMFLPPEPAAFALASAPAEFPFSVIHTQHRGPACGNHRKIVSPSAFGEILNCVWGQMGITGKTWKGLLEAPFHSLLALKARSTGEGTLQRMQKAVSLLLFCALRGLQASMGLGLGRLGRLVGKES